MRIQNQLIIINIIGGFFVLGGYVYALMANPTNRMQLWGGVPENYRSWIVGMMFVSAFGYCYAMKFLLLDDGIPLKFFFGLMGERFILITQIIFLLSAALWIHTTFSHLNEPSQTKWFLINIELWSTGLSVLAIFLGVVFINDRPSSCEYYLAVIGLFAISFHCIFLDALLWINKFPKLQE